MNRADYVYLCSFCRYNKALTHSARIYGMAQVAGLATKRHV